MKSENGVQMAQQLQELTANDRKWVLAQLNNLEVRSELESALESLDSAVVSGSPIDNRGIVENGDQAILYLSKLHAREIILAFEEESNWVKLTILNAYDWSWKKAVIRHSIRKKIVKKYKQEPLTINSGICKLLLTQFVKKVKNHVDTTTPFDKRQSLFYSVLVRTSTRLKASSQTRDYRKL